MALLQDVGGVVTADADDGFHAPGAFLDGQLNELVVLFLGVRRVFTGGPADENGGGAALILEIDEFLILRVIDAVFEVWRDDGGT